MFDAEEFISLLKSLSGKNLFNPYTDECSLHDRKDGARIRERNLRKYLSALSKTKTLILGEAPGFLGCIRSGLPFTDTRHLYDYNSFKKIMTFDLVRRFLLIYIF